MIDTTLWSVFASKIIAILTLSTITVLSKALLIKLIELVARIFSAPRGLRQYIKLAISEPTFWIDNLIGFGPNGVRQHTRARARHFISFIGAIVGYLVLTVSTAYLAALYLGEQHLTAYGSNLGISPYPYNVTQWGRSSTKTHGLILGPILVTPNLTSWQKATTVAVLSNSAVVNLHVSLSTSPLDANNEISFRLNGYYLSVGNVIIQPGDSTFCNKVFDGIYTPGYMLITNSTLSEYFNVGVVAPTLQVWTDEDGSATGLAIEECLKHTVVFGYDVSGPYLLNVSAVLASRPFDFGLADGGCLPSTFEQWLLVLLHWRFGRFHQH